MTVLAGLAAKEGPKPRGRRFAAEPEEIAEEWGSRCWKRIPLGLGELGVVKPRYHHYLTLPNTTQAQATGMLFHMHGNWHHILYQKYVIPFRG